jgi:hypothetical protein
MTTLQTRHAALQPQVPAAVRIATAVAVALVLALAWAGAGRASHHAVESAQVALSGAAPLLAKQAPVVIVGRRDTSARRI